MESSHKSILKRLAALAASLLLIWFFMYHLGPWLKNLPAVRPLMNFIEERGIDATALYYTDIEEFAEADVQMNHSMDYTPHGP